MRTMTLLLVSVLALPLCAAQRAVQDRAPRFRSAARLIQVSVIVEDSRRRHLRDLARGDFTVFEDGQEVPIAFFLPAQRSPGEGAERLEPASAPATPRGAAFTNRIESPGGGGVVAIIFDQLNMSATQQSRARSHLLTYLKTLRAGDRVALYSLGAGGLQVLYDFTADASILVRMLEAIRTGAFSKMAPSELQLPPALTEGLNAFASGSITNMNAAMAALRTETTLEALESVAAHLAGVPGRKNIVWISAGFPFIITSATPGGPTRQYVSELTKRATRALNTTDAAVYPVDIRGLMAGRGAALPTLNNIYAPIEGLRSIADWTGGRAFFNDNDIAAAIGRAVDDSRDTYVLGYYAVNQNWDGRFRRIQVKVARKGANVRHRGGYVADPGAVPAQDDRQRAVLATLASPLEATGLPFHVHAEGAGDGVLLRIRVDATHLSLPERDGQLTGEVDVAITQLLKDRQQIAEMSASMPVTVAAADRERLLATPIELTRTVRLHPQVLQVRVVMRDAASGAIGSVFVDAERLRAAHPR